MQDDQTNLILDQVRQARALDRNFKYAVQVLKISLGLLHQTWLG